MGEERVTARDKCEMTSNRYEDGGNEAKARLKSDKRKNNSA